MKKISLIIVLLLGVVTTFAHGNHNAKSSLNLKLWNNSSFDIILDGQHYGQTSHFNMANLKPGTYSLMVARTVHPHHSNGGFKKVYYNGSINIPFGSNVLATITPNHKIDVQVIKNKHGYYHNNGYGNNSCCNIQPKPYCSNSMVMSNSNFNNLMSSITNTSFDSSKLILAKQALQYNMLSTHQVTLIMNEFSFESNRLEFAKFAYNKTIDKQNYFLVNELFSFNSSINNLNNYIFQQI